MQQAFENNDPDDILRAKQLASTFIGPCLGPHRGSRPGTRG